MSRVFIIGLPKLVRNRVEAALKAAGYFARSIQADRLEKRGILALLPDASHAPGMLRDYCDSLDSYDQAKIYVLPFALVPEEVYSELDCLEDMGAEIVEFEMGEDGCPTVDAINPTLDQAFQDDVVGFLKRQVIGEQLDVLPSEYIQGMVAQLPQLIVVNNAADLCDQVAKSRFPWIISAIDAFAEMIRANGDVGEHEPFFSQRGLILAQTGGISVGLDVHFEGRSIRDSESSVHLKKGDHTTPQAAARIYYQVLSHRQKFYVFLLYIGPHPDRDFERTYHLI
ncbi:TPA: hypothetical protein ACVGNB_001864 [Pseudomonas aeruginosa]|nr:hypothetical protein [Pseudomonas aeruginosa]